VRRLVPKAQVRVAQIALRTFVLKCYTVITAQQAALMSDEGLQFLVLSSSIISADLLSVADCWRRIPPRNESIQGKLPDCCLPIVCSHNAQCQHDRQSSIVNRYKHCLTLTA
jgi:hypothetical protein